MWVELQLGPFYEKKRGRCALIWDNCGPHGVAATKAICNENGVFDMPLPKNMTNECAASDGPHRERAHEDAGPQTAELRTAELRTAELPAAE